MWLVRKKTLSDLAERIDRIENQLVRDRLDWDELYQKCRKLMGRVSKESAKMQELQDGTPTPIASPVSGSGRSALLTDRQLQVQREILRRRAGG